MSTVQHQHSLTMSQTAEQIAKDLGGIVQWGKHATIVTFSTQDSLEKFIQWLRNRNYRYSVIDYRVDYWRENLALVTSRG